MDEGQTSASSHIQCRKVFDLSAAPTTTVTHRYNLLGQRIATDLAADGKAAEPLARYHYNADGSLAETTLGPDGLPRKYRYDPLGELTQIADPAMTETLGYKLPGGEGYGDGNVTQAAYDLHYADGVSHTYSYSYDPHDRLTAAQNDQVQLPGSSLESVTYDPNGNIQTERRGDGQTRTYALAPKTNQVATVTGDGVNAHYVYDAKGRMSGASGDGAPDVASLDYDPLTNLPRQVSGADELEVDYHYDVHNRRVAKVGHRADGSSSTRVYYRGQGATALTELAGDAAAPELQTYLRGPGGLQAVTLQGQRYFVSRDHLGSTRALMDTAGKVAAYFNYTPFGSLMSGNSQDSDGLAAHMAYRFAGTEFDLETGLYNNRARWYDPALGRFLTPDPDHQYPSPYVYVGNNPVNGVDPTGMDDEGLIWIGIEKKVPANNNAMTDNDAITEHDVRTDYEGDYAPIGNWEPGDRVATPRIEPFPEGEDASQFIEEEARVSRDSGRLASSKFVDRGLAPPDHNVTIEVSMPDLDKHKTPTGTYTKYTVKITGGEVDSESFARTLISRIKRFSRNSVFKEKMIEEVSRDVRLHGRHVFDIRRPGFGSIRSENDIALIVQSRISSTPQSDRTGFQNYIHGKDLDDLRKISEVAHGNRLALHVRRGYDVAIWVRIRALLLVRLYRVLI